MFHPLRGEDVHRGCGVNRGHKAAIGPRLGEIVQVNPTIADRRGN